MTPPKIAVALVCVWLVAVTVHAQSPQLINYQGRVVVGSNNFDGTGGFKFALVNSNGSESYWSNNNSSVAGSEPTTAVSLTVSKGLYSVLLGNSPMVPIPASVFTNNSDVRLRVWFSDGVNGFQLLSPDQRIAAVGYAMLANSVPNSAITTDKLAFQAVDASKIALGAVGSSQLANGAVGATQIASGAILSGHIGQNAIQSFNLASGAVGSLALQPSAVTLSHLATSVVPQLLQSLHNPAPASDDNFGAAIAAVGIDNIMIGAPQDDGNGSNSGAAYLFDSSGNLLLTFVDPSATPQGNRFGTDIAAIGTDKVLITSPAADVGANGAGAVFLFDLSGNLIRTFVNPTPQNADDFGRSVALVGSFLLIGAPQDKSGIPSQSGSAYLFDLNSGALVRTFNNPTPAVDDYFGYAVSAVGTDKVLISAPADDTGATDAGSAYLFAVDGTLLRTINNPDAAMNDSFGAAVAALGATNLIIGAPTDDAGAVDAGSVYLYDLNGSLVRTFNNPTPAINDLFGGRVAGAGNSDIFVGAKYNDQATGGGGSVYQFRNTGTLLRTFNHPTRATTAAFGSAIAVLSGNRIAVGAELDGAGASNAGSAYVLSLNQTTTQIAGLTAESVGAGAVTTEGLSYGAVTNDKLAANAVSGENIADNAITAAKLDSAFSADLARRSASQVFAGSNTFSNASNSFAGSGAGLTALNASNIASGSLSDGRLSTNVVLGNNTQTISGAKIFSSTSNSFTGSGSGLTNLNATNLSSGTVADARLTSNVALRNASNGFSGTQTISAGNLGVGAASPGERMEIWGSDATVRIKNINDAIGGWIGDSFGALQLGIYNPSASAVGVIPANTKRSFFGVDGTTGQVGSLTNNFFAPSFRVELDDGNGNLRLNDGGDIRLTVRPLTNPQAAGRIHIPEVAGQYFTLGNSGFGYQNAIVVGGPGAGHYQRSSGDFFWYNGGSHAPNPGDPGSGGTMLMNLDVTGLGVGRSAAANKLEVEGNASKATAGSWLANSDARIKTDIQPVAGALARLARVRPVQFHYSAEYRKAHPAIEDRDYLNVIAQDFQEVFPEWVKESGEKLADGEYILQVDTYPLTILSVSAIQELRSENDRLKQENALLTQRLERLERAVENLNARSRP